MIYILNRLPARAVSGVTPYEVWSRDKPHVEHIRVFGCVVHMKLPTVNLRKLDDRSKAVVYLGKEPGSKAYRLYDPETKAVLVSRDVVFEEEKCWPWHLEGQATDQQLGTFTVTVNGVTGIMGSSNFEEMEEVTTPQSTGTGTETPFSSQDSSATELV